MGGSFDAACLSVFRPSTAISCPFAMVACHAPFGLVAGLCVDCLSTTSFCKLPLVPHLTRVVRSLSPTGRIGGLASRLFEGVASGFFQSIVSATASDPAIEVFGNIVEIEIA